MENINDNDPSPEDENIDSAGDETVADSIDPEDVQEGTADLGEHTDVVGEDTDVVGEDTDVVGEDTDVVGEHTDTHELGDESEYADAVNDFVERGDFAEHDDPVDAGTTAHDEPTEPTAAIPPPPAQPVAEERLTRDPFATFGGVLSGIAHHYGWDVALTRLAFVIVLLATGGTAFLVYLLAWLIIPRANFWPPVRSARSGRTGLSGRDLGIGLIALAALIAIGAGSGQAAAVLVPLALIGGGIWMLVQNPREAAAPAFVGAGAPAAGGGSFEAQNMSAYSAPVTPPVQQLEAPKRSRFRRVGIIGGIMLIGLFLLSLIAIPLIIVAAIAEGDLEFDAGETIVLDFDDVDELPSFISEDAGDLRVDLRDIDFSTVDADDPIRLDVDLGLGDLTVRLPEDVRVDIEAESDFVGEVELFGQASDGISPERTVREDDPQLILDLEVNAGRIEVTRGGFTSTRTVTIETN